MTSEQTARPALIIEDEMLIAWATRDVVEGAGFSPVMVVTTDHSAGLAAEGSDLSIVICDLDLGKFSENGLETLERIDPDEKIATVIYTGIDKSLVSETIKARRPNSVILNKPASDEELRGALNEALSKRQRVGISNFE